MLKEPDGASRRERLAELDRIEEQARHFAYQSPTLTFDRELTVDIGNCRVEVKHLGRGNTVGDALVYLPREKILVTGDLLVRPVPYAFDGYPAEWIRTLESMGGSMRRRSFPGMGPSCMTRHFST